ERLRSALKRPHPTLVLIGRRELRSNNSWMHNLPALMKGDEQCTLLIHPDDATRLGLSEGAFANICSETSTVKAPVHVTDTIMPGVVSLPHGWGHNLPGTRLGTAAAHAGVSINRLISDVQIEPLSGNAVLSAVAVSISPLQETVEAEP